jgi:hypothetical protein
VCALTCGFLPEKNWTCGCDWFPGGEIAGIH